MENGTGYESQDALTSAKLVKQDIQNIIKQAIDKNALVKGLLLSTGYYDKILENVPDVILILSRDNEGINVLKRLGLYGYFTQD